MKITYHRDGTISMKGMRKAEINCLLSHATCDAIRSSIKAREEGNTSLENICLESYAKYHGIRTFLDHAGKGESESFNF